MYKTQSFKKKMLVTAVASVVMTGVLSPVMAQEEAVEEVIVLGVKGAQETSVNTKRNSASIVDSITAEDIGKLPDATISDSLQRIPGIQIRRSAGEGGSVNVRGMSQVSSQLNGEAYLGAGSITNFQPNFGDIPSQLFKGADVIKSPTANLLNSGLSGTINLKTRRPFDFDDGVSGGAAVEVGSGSDSQETDPSFNGLVNFKGESAGLMLAVVKSEANLLNDYAGKLYGQDLGADGLQAEGGSRGGLYGGNFVGDADTTTGERFYAPEGWNAFALGTEREREGMNLSFQAELGNGFEFIGDYFYTSQDEWNRASGMVAETKWENCCNFNNFVVTQSSEHGPAADKINAAETFVYQPRRVQSYAEVVEFFSLSQNTNLQLNYDNGGPLTASFRYIYGSASQDRLHNYLQADLADGGPTNTGVWTDGVLGNRLPGVWVNPNPNGYKGVAQFTLDHSGSPKWSGFDAPLYTGAPGSNGLFTTAANGGKTLESYMTDLSSYNVAAVSSENNYNREGDLEAKRLDLSYKFEDNFITSVDFGVRKSEKNMSNSVWHGVSNFFAGEDGVTSTGAANPNGCLARWKATDIHFNGDCQVGEVVSGTWQPWTAIGYVPLSSLPNVKISNFGAVSGIPDMWGADPRSLDDVKAYHTEFYGNFIKSEDPGASYDVQLEDLAGYLQASFEFGSLTGNLGARVVTTDLTVRQNVRGSDRSYGMAAADAGDLYTETRFRDVLPALNMAYEVNDDIKLRAAYSENMTPLDLDSWGRSVVTNYSQSSGDGIWRINSVSYDGNPGLDPWRSETMELSSEWYFAEGSMASIGYFKMDIDSFPETGRFREPYPDLDGVIRNQAVDITRAIAGKGGSLDGIEMGVKYSFDVLPIGIDANLTLTDSENKGVKDVNGDNPPLTDNSETQYNLVLWYQDDALQARLAYNYRDDRVTGSRVGVDANRSLIQYQEGIGYLDASVSYDFTDYLTVYLNASNITGEDERYYLQWPEQYTGTRGYESRYTLGVRTRF